MSRLTCTNPSCGRSVPVSVQAKPGVRYACPHCGKALPPVPDPDEDEDEDEEPGRKYSDLQVWGVVILCIGITVTIIGMLLGTTVESSAGTIHNLGLLANRICVVIIGVGVAVIGALFLSRPPPPTK
jgi:hypothetical protein